MAKFSIRLPGGTTAVAAPVVKSSNIILPFGLQHQIPQQVTIRPPIPVKPVLQIKSGPITKGRPLKLFQPLTNVSRPTVRNDRSGTRADSILNSKTALEIQRSVSSITMGTGLTQILLTVGILGLAFKFIKGF